MIYLIHVAIAATMFLFVLNGFLRGSKKPQIDALLMLVFLGLLTAAFLVSGWRTGVLAIALALAYGAIARAPAAKLAARLMSIPESHGGSHIGLPSPRLERISGELGRGIPSRNARELMEDADRRQRAESEFFEYCMTRPELQEIIREFGVTPNFLSDRYRTLCAGGAGQWRGGHYVAASAIAYPHTLRFLLESEQAGMKEIDKIYALIMHFERGTPLPKERDV